MRKAKVFVNNLEAGLLTEREFGKKYLVEYLPGYSGSPVSLTMPVGGVIMNLIHSLHFLNIKNGFFEIVDLNGKYILKPQHPYFPELPQNEDLTMRLAATIGIEVPLHGMVWSKDNSLTYFIKRFDRKGQHDKVAVEDFSQLAGLGRETKYNYSMEKVVKIIDTYCTFPAIEKAELLKRVLFNFLVGNEDMHLKNYSVFWQRALWLNG
jgi:hypothetical protein